MKIDLYQIFIFLKHIIIELYVIPYESVIMNLGKKIKFPTGNYIQGWMIHFSKCTFDSNRLSVLILLKITYHFQG